MDQKIINTLIDCKQNFDTHFESFAFKQDLEAVFAHEYEHYVIPVCEKVVPLLYENLRENRHIKISDYYPYIVAKYHDIVKKEVQDYEKNANRSPEHMGKDLVENFLSDLMKAAKENEANRLVFINGFFKKSYYIFQSIVRQDPLYALNICAQMRNPKMQSLIVNTFQAPLNAYIEAQDSATFEADILPLFVYPVDANVEQYYNKWIAKDAIHVKTCKKILGKYYEHAKQKLKNNEKIKRQKKKEQAALDAQKDLG